MDINDIREQAIERIYLIPDTSEGQLGYVWCDDPAPGEGMDPAEAVEYVRKDVHDAAIAELEEREAALAKERDALRIAEDHQISMRLSAENHVARLRSALAYASDYLNSNKLNTIGYASKAHCEMRFALASYSMIGSRLHTDDIAVDKFSLAMKEKLSASREKGRGGWEDPEVCTASQLAEMLISHLEKGNGGTFQDIANFAMMLHQRGEDPFVLAISLARRDAEQQRIGAASFKAEAHNASVLPVKIHLEGVFAAWMSKHERGLQ